MSPADGLAGALDGVRVIDFSQVAAGPYLSSLLGDLGADVIKVEPLGGDSLRDIDDAFGRRGSSYYFGVNRSKRGLAMDLHSERAQDVIDRLAKDADVLIVAMRPSALARSGLNSERLRELNPRLIHVSITGFGPTGPRAGEPGMDIIAQALSGVMGLTGETGRTPVRVGPPVADISSSYLGGFAVCAALRARERDDVGQAIELNLLSSAISLLPNYAAQYLRTGEPIEPQGTGHPQIVPYQAFETSDGHMIVACLSDRFWPPLCEAIGRTDLVDLPEFHTNGVRVINREPLVALLSEILRKRATAHWIERLSAVSVPCAEIHPLHDVFADPQVVYNHSVVELTHPRVGAYRVLDNPFSMSGTPPRARGHAPDVGEHTSEILAELGFTPDEIDELVAGATVVAPEHVEESA